MRRCVGVSAKAIVAMYFFCACGGQPAEDTVLVKVSGVETILTDTTLAIPLRSLSRPKAILYVDATCPNSLYVLERALADSMVAKSVALGYSPQVQRDPVARFEVAALECARQLGALSAYVSQRLDDAARGWSAVDLTARAAGIDTIAFMKCVASPKTDSIVARHERSAADIGVSLLPMLANRGVGTVGRDSVIMALARIR